MGINTGFCNVGNFGSIDRMDYTAIGAEVNLAARLQSIAEPGHVVISYETYALVRDIVAARALPEITVKGISRAVVPYVVEGVLDEAGRKIEIFPLSGRQIHMKMWRRTRRCLVCSWHLTDMPAHPPNVCYPGKAGVTRTSRDVCL
jgi:hypothetical protein